MDEVFEGLATEPPSRTFFPALYDHFAQAKAWRMYDDVLPTLDALAASGIHLGIISNWDERLRGLLDLLQLRDRFDAIVISCEVGSPKPSPAIFAQAAMKLGLPPAAILHVGDSEEADIQGAKAAGFQAVRIHRNVAKSQGDTIRSLQDLMIKVAPV